MNAKQKFETMFNWMSEDAKRNLVYNSYGNHPMSINIIYCEIKDDTKLGKDMLKKLGFQDD